MNISETILRERLFSLARGYMSHDMGSARRANFMFHKGIKAHLLEYAHTPMLPHMGIVRILVDNYRKCLAEGKVFLFCLNDQLPPREIGESRYLPFCNVNGPIAKPPRFGPPKSSSYMGMGWLEPPKHKRLNSFCERWLELDSKASDRIIGIIHLMQKAADECVSYGAWLGRIIFDLLEIEALFVPTSKLEKIFPEALAELKEYGGRFGWSYCPSCGYRLGRWQADNTNCPKCGYAVLDGGHFIPDVIGRQILFNLLEINERVCGKEKSYQRKADQASIEIFGVEPPLRTRYKGITHFKDKDIGINCPRINLFQAITRLPNGFLSNPDLLIPDRENNWYISVD